MTQKKPAGKKKTIIRKPVMQFVVTHHEELCFDSAERQRKIEEVAYLIAEQRGFQGDHAFDDWLQAEVLVDAGIDAPGIDAMR
ncbi:MAG: DUF2934 domain-containing protein [Gammaproteobacteria bacterium]|nr:DUF2934 domain-containing protein [Gammaproteobacteria bacterium]